MKTATTAKYWTPTATSAAFCRECERESAGRSVSVEKWQQTLNDKSTVAIAFGTGVKAIAVAVYTRDGLKLLTCCVRPGYRRRGIGKQLVHMLASKSRLHIKLRETNLSALHFATKCGFVVDKLERDGYDNCDAIHLSKEPTIDN